MAEQFCDQCDSKGVVHKKECPKREVKAHSEGGFVKKEDFTTFKEETDKKLDLILDVLAAKAKRDAEKEPKEEPKEDVKIYSGDPVAESGTEPFFGTVGNLPSQFQAVFMKHFDPNDGFTAEYDPIENTFDIIVPSKLSNAVPANLEFYKVDKRRKKLEANNPLATIDAWCVKVVKNLRYSRNTMTKQT